jgi:hypothetical protein
MIMVHDDPNGTTSRTSRLRVLWRKGSPGSSNVRKSLSFGMEPSRWHDMTFHTLRVRGTTSGITWHCTLGVTYRIMCFWGFDYGSSALALPYCSLPPAMDKDIQLELGLL